MFNWIKKRIPTAEMRAYRRLHRRHRKQLVKLARNTYEWDWRYLHDAVILIVKQFYEYYSEGNNVWQVDESKDQILKQLKQIIELDKEIEETTYADLGIKYEKTEDGGLVMSKPEEARELLAANEEELQKLYEELYSSIGENLRWWWD